MELDCIFFFSFFYGGMSSRCNLFAHYKVENIHRKYAF